MRKVVQYRTKTNRADENQALIEKVFGELDSARPEGLRYASLRMNDGVSFLHIAEIDTPHGSNPLAATAAFTEFQRDLADRCEVQPHAVDATIVGNYGLLAG